MDPYAYMPGQTEFKLEQRAGGAGLKLSFEPAVTSPYIGSHAGGEYHRPRRTKPPLAIIAHGMGDTSLIPVRLLARSLLASGWACYLPYLPIHSSRVPAGMNLTTLSDEGWNDIYRSSVIEIRQALDWAAGRQDLDCERLALIGVSFGGFVSTIAMSRDKRIRAGVLIESGGNATKTARLSGAMRRRFPRPHRDYAALEKAYQGYLSEVASRGFENVEPQERFFQNDPLTFAPGLRDRPMLMVCGIYDELIPRQAARDVWQAAGRPEILWLPASHVTLWAYYPLISRRVRSFLERHAAAVTLAPPQANVL